MSRLKKSAKMAGVVFLSIIFTTGCSSKETIGFGFNPGLSSVTDISLPLWQGAWIAALVVGAFTAALILWAAIFHRKKMKIFPSKLVITFQPKLPIR